MIYFDSYIEYEYNAMNDFIEKEMHKHKENTLKKLSSFMHFETEDFVKILSYAWFDSLETASRLAEKLNLSKIDFLSIEEDLEGFKKEYLKNYEEAQNF
jgi:hypothetical protein